MDKHYLVGGNHAYSGVHVSVNDEGVLFSRWVWNGSDDVYISWKDIPEIMDILDKAKPDSADSKDSVGG